MIGTIQKIWLNSVMRPNTHAVLTKAAMKAMANVGLRPIRCVHAAEPEHSEEMRRD